MIYRKHSRFRILIYVMAAFALLLFLITLARSETARAALFVSAFIGLNMLLSSYKRFIRVPVEFELLTLGIVICTMQFGLKAGLVVAILGGILGFIVGFNISPFSFPMLLGYMLIAVISFFLKGIPLHMAGIIASVANNIFVFALYSWLFDYDLFKNLSFSISNITFNLILFLNFSPLLIMFIR